MDDAVSGKLEAVTQNRNAANFLLNFRVFSGGFRFSLSVITGTVNEMHDARKEQWMTSP